MSDLGFIGPAGLGDTVRLALQCRNASDVVPAPTSAPTWSAYLVNGGDDTPIATGTLGAADADSNVGFRTGDMVASSGEGFAAGNLYRILFEYAENSNNHADVATILIQ